MWIVFYQQKKIIIVKRAIDGYKAQSAALNWPLSAPESLRTSPLAIIESCFPASPLLTPIKALQPFPLAPRYWVKQ
jgi:hypothetical protein